MKKEDGATEDNPLERSSVKKKKRPKAQTSWFQKRRAIEPLLTHPLQAERQRNPRPKWRHLTTTQLKMEKQRHCPIQHHHLKGES